MKTKAFLVIILIILMNSRSYSQNTRHTIFELRLGMTITEMKKVVDVSLLEEYKYRESSIVNDDVGEELTFFYLKRYAAYGLFYDKVKLAFFEDKLYEIDINTENATLLNQLTQQYGKAKITKEESEDSPVETSHAYSIEWETGDKNINCEMTHYQNSKRDSDYYFLRLENRAISLAIDIANIKKKVLDFQIELPTPWANVKAIYGTTGEKLFDTKFYANEKWESVDSEIYYCLAFRANIGSFYIKTFKQNPNLIVIYKTRTVDFEEFDKKDYLELYEVKYLEKTGRASLFKENEKGAKIRLYDITFNGDKSRAYLHP